MAIPAETLFLDPDAEGTLQSQIQQMIAEGILSGRFQRGERLPSSRKLAQQLGVSRITVTLAYTELVAEDYISAKGRSGYYVSDSAPQTPSFPLTTREDKVDWSRVLTRKFSQRRALVKPTNWRSYKYPFIYGQADPTLFDIPNWRLCALQALGQRDFDALTTDYHDQDDPKLIEFIARHTLPRRGIVAQSDEILVTMGAQNALWLASQVLLTPHRRAAIEDPCYPSLRDILTQMRCHLDAIPVDGDGLPPDEIPGDTDVVFTTPSHQCPTNATMPVDRRQALLAKAARDDFLIVEDDYEFEMSFLKAPSPALKSLDREGRVVYVGSFSKSLFPGLRLGYLVGSAEFIREARALRATVLRHPPGHIQRTAAYFLSLGHYDALIRRTSRALQERRETIEKAIRANGLMIAGRGAFGGSSLWMDTGGPSATALIEALAQEGVLIESGAPFFAAQDSDRFYRLAYSSIPSNLIPDGIAKIAKVLAKG
ncbi:PLP-dependent aminotransferase family protein [Shimia ponticola]|uniref:MocR-like pyridoxine biosynthesis transcription factor PdxR n=1 Tax=Shimia ponticola TaxID=2582893 RepID=UPI0011BEF8FC|nr:PLP-dependent aminotransferase family protein [Shimia ponticola]